jgi:hypothetical protein
LGATRSSEDPLTDRFEIFQWVTVIVTPVAAFNRLDQIAGRIE